MVLGSSPHVRGTLDADSGVVAAIGIIPACAGNTSWRMTPLAYTSGSSPHVRGTHRSAMSVLSTLGIIPACAGTHRSAMSVLSTLGIIPACAGNTIIITDSECYIWDHPRMCGEHDLMVINSLEDLGSSPHVRGTHQHHYPMPDTLGIIPACAGNTKFGNIIGHLIGDHPRMCGEHST